jgi:hypothetical protein
MIESARGKRANHLALSSFLKAETAAFAEQRDKLVGSSVAVTQRISP